MNAVLQLSRQAGLSETNAAWLSKRPYTASQELVDDLLTYVDNLNAHILPEDLNEVKRSAEESFRTVSPFHAEYRIRHPSKGDHWMKANFMPDMQENGAMLWHGFITDITERKQVVVEKQRLLAILEESADFVGSADLQGKLLYHNQAALDMVGLSKDADLSTLHFSDMHPAWAAKLLQETAIPTVLAQGIWRGDTALLHRDGQEIPVSQLLVLHRDVDGQPEFISIIMHDIINRKCMEEQLARKQLELHTLIDNTPDVIIRYDRDCRRIWISENYEQLSGNPVSVAFGRKPTESWGRPRMAAEEYERLLREVMANGESKDIELDWFTPDGKYVCQSLRVVPEYDAKGEICSALTFSRDVSELKRAEHKAQVSEQEFRTMIEHSPNMTVRYDLECRLVFVNPAYEIASGFTQVDALGKALADNWLPENISSEAYKAQLQYVMKSGESTNVILEWTAPDGILVSHDMRIVPEYDVNEQTKGTLVIGHNISRLRQTEIELTKREQEFRALVEHSPDTISRYDRECRRIYVNPRMQIDSGIPLDELMYKTPVEFPGGERAAAYQEKIRQVLGSGEASQFELTWHTHNSKEMCSHIHLTPELDPKGNVVSILAVGRDITEIDAYRKQIHNLAFFDPLTNLPNRSLLSDCIRQTVDDTSCHGHQFGLMMIDLDRFKEINDTLGHSIGNQILREAAQRLQGCVRICDTVARLGGDEFAILLPKIYSGLDLETIACKILVAFNHPFIVDGRELFVSGSIGIALYPDDSADIETLFSYADSAMYHAKQQGRNNYQFFSANLTEKAVWRMSIENDLRKAQERNELELHYQPQVELESGKIIGAEALLRWNHSKKGLIAPDKFISVAEETGLIVGIGEWVLLSACQAAVAWNANREIPLCIAVNLSTRQFIRNDLVGTVQRILQETACNPSWIKLEITESLLLEDSTEIATMLDTFNSMGHAISIDDFGTGYSALSYLNRFPVSQIKIDRSFVKDIPNDHDKTELVKVMISISQVLKMELVAEGVETREQADCLLANGCVIVQGYLFGKPMPYAAFEKLMANSVC